MVTWKVKSPYQNAICKVSVTLNCLTRKKKIYNSITIRINRNLQTIDNKLEKSLENEDEIESCSSVVELEPNELKADSFVLSEPVQDLTSLQKNVTSMSDSCLATSPSEFPSVSLPLTLLSYLEQKLTRFPFLMKQLAEKVHHSDEFVFY